MRRNGPTFEVVKNKIEIILHRGAKLLSKEFKNSKDKLDIQCENAHLFSVNWNNINSGKWCPYCAGVKKKTIQELKDKVEQELHTGSKVISSKYVNSKTKLDIICEKSHPFSITWDHIQSGKWCPYCAGNRKHNYQYIKTQIEDVLHKGAKLLSSSYTNAYTKLEIQCEKGHLFNTPWTNIQSGSWCLDCAGTKKKTIDYIKYKIENELHPASKLLSNEYINTHQKLKIQCEKGHRFESPWSSVQTGIWCPYCVGKNKKTIEEIKNKIENELHQGSKLISTEYFGNKSKLTLQCEKGHTFTAAWGHLQSGKWCPDCGGTKTKSITDVKYKIEHELHPGSKLLSKKYFNTHTKLSIMCENNHQFEAAWSTLQAGFWCPSCFGNKKLTIDFVKNQIENKYHPGAKLLNVVYKNSTTKLDIMCENGHEFKISYADIRSNYWCGECSSYKGERTVRLLFNTIFSANFNKAKPKWLKNKNGSYLELDGYNKDLKIAFEHQGKQHFEYSKRFHSSKDDFYKTQEHDKIKLIECDKRDITLIVIPDIFNLLKIDLKKYIENEFQRLGKSNLLPSNYNQIEIDYSSLYKTEYAYIKEQIESILHPRAKLHSTVYISGSSKLDVECENQHRFITNWNYIKSGRWCMKCSIKKRSQGQKHTFQFIKNNIENVLHQGSILISSTYVNSKSKLEIRCSNNHIFKADWGHISQGKWCPYCSRNKIYKPL